MEEIIKQVLSQETILNLLDIFTPYFKSLSTGKVDKKTLSAKFYKFGHVFQLMKGPHIIAFAAFYCNDKVDHQAFLSMIAVKPEYSRHGYGTKIFAYVIEKAQNSGMKSRVLDVGKENMAAIKFYQKLGFSFLKKCNDNSYFMSRNL